MAKMWTLRIDSDELEGWRGAALAEGVPLAVWVRRACAEQLALVGALAREDEVRPVVVRDAVARPGRDYAVGDLAGKFKPYPRS